MGVGGKGSATEHFGNKMCINFLAEPWRKQHITNRFENRTEFPGA